MNIWHKHAIYVPTGPRAHSLALHPLHRANHLRLMH
uniref:Uncharacterized protein n=1 Tax=Anopheles arabiensis TaxID=7173 RepID=A0A182IG04_ANOAR